MELSTDLEITQLGESMQTMGVDLGLVYVLHYMQCVSIFNHIT